MMLAVSAPERRDLLAELADRDDWRAVVDALHLSEREAHALRVAVLRCRWWGGARSTRRRP
jgi:hypothetical protein